MEIMRIPRLMQDTALTARMKGRSVGFVPTMGALHEGHLSLVRASRQENDLTVVSIFVNPTQFNDPRDFDLYPRDADRDMKVLAAVAVDVVFLPAPEAIYPPGHATSVEVGGGIAERLCGAARPGHFRGVATVVTKLLGIVLPKRAYFGLKDYQQCLVVKRLVRDLYLPVEVVACPTRREHDGLAMSSRNERLNARQRAAAPALYAELSRAAEGLRAGGLTPAKAAKALASALASATEFTGLDYAGVYDPATLEPLGKFEGRAVVAAAVHMGDVRLIDNILI
jgi:pantoate--beta-alanine ligase